MGSPRQTARSGKAKCDTTFVEPMLTTGAPAVPDQFSSDELSPGHISWAELHDRLHLVVDGSYHPEPLQQRLEFSAQGLLDALSSRSTAEEAQVQNPNFAHRGHTLEPAGRQSVIELSKRLQLSELACWDLLYEHISGQPAGVELNLKALLEQIVQGYCRERHSMMLLLMEVLIIRSKAATDRNRALPAAMAFLGRIGQVGGDSSELTRRLLRMIEALSVPSSALDQQRGKVPLRPPPLFFPFAPPLCPSPLHSLSPSSPSALCPPLCRHLPPCPDIQHGERLPI